MKNIPQGWYAVLESEKLKPGQVLGLERFATDMVFWRLADGKAVVQRDLCPHRFAKLSLGKIVNQNLECPFHGFQYAADGTCQWIPEVETKAEKICVQTYFVHEEFGFIFLWNGKDQPKIKPNWLSDLDDSFAHSGFTTTWPMHYSRCVENQLDYIHLPFVHKKTIGKFASTKMKPRSEISADRIYWSTDQKNPAQFYIEFLRANIWQNRLNPWLSLVLIFIPINETSTQLILRTYHQKFKIFGIRHLFGWTMSLLNKKILNEDYSIVKSQTNEATAMIQDEILVGSDQFIRVFRDWSKDHS